MGVGVWISTQHLLAYLLDGQKVVRQSGLKEERRQRHQLMLVSAEPVWPLGVKIPGWKGNYIIKELAAGEQLVLL